MAVSINMIWEVRPSTGSDTNGGGFVVSATGTDYSKQATAQYALTGLTTAAANAIILSASAAAVMVGNVIYISGGTNFIVGWYEITAVSVGVSMTVDRNCTSAAGASGTGNVGGALATIQVAHDAAVARNRIYVKAEATISPATNLALSKSVDPSGAADSTRLIGYNTTRGDGLTAGNQVTIQLGGGATVCLVCTNGAHYVTGFILDCNNVAASSGITIANNGNGFTIHHCIVKNFKTRGIYNSNGSNTGIGWCEVTAGASGATAGIQNAFICLINNCWVHDNVCPGIYNSSTGATQIRDNLIVNNTGSTSDGIIGDPNGDNYLIGNTVYGSGRDGIRNTTSYRECILIKQNLLVNNVGYGLKCTGTAGPADFLLDGNVYYNNTTGARNGVDSTTGIFADPNQYTNTLDVTLTGDPFTNAAGGDFTLNATAGAGAAARGIGFPGTLFNYGYLSYRDAGPLQHADPASVFSVNVSNVAVLDGPSRVIGV